MPFAHGKDTVVKIGGDDLSAYTDSTEFNDETAMSKVTTYGRQRENYVSGLGDGTITIGGSYDYGVTGPGAILNPLKLSGATEPFIYQVAGTGTGLPQRLVDVKVKKFTTSSPVADKVAWSAELQMVGDEINDDAQV
jgi:hypothetical protein